MEKTAGMNPEYLETRLTSLPSWYCVRTQPKHEHIAAASLARNLGLEVFHPRLRLERATRRGQMRVIEPLFPGYIFVRCTLDDCLHDVRYMIGVTSFVHFGQRIPIVPEGVVEELRRCFETDEPMLAEDPLTVGAEVIVAEGAFAGFRGVVMRRLSARRRVQILLDFLGQTTITEVDRGSLILENSCVVDLVPSLAREARLSLAAAG